MKSKAGGQSAVVSRTGRMQADVSSRRFLDVPLFVTCLGYFVVILDVTIVNVALPSLDRDLGTAVTGLQWVVDGYTLIFASALLSAGGLADRLGSKQAFMAGVLLFTIASVGCGLSPTASWLIGLRLIQGLGAALVVPSSLALIRAAYDDRADRARAIGMWATIGGVAAGCGPVLGGFLAGTLGWRAVFLVNLPFGLLNLALAARYVSAPPVPRRSGGDFDVLAQLAGLIGLASITYALVEAGRQGWTSPLVLSGFAVSAFAVPVFILLEQRSPHPMLPLDLFRGHSFSAATVVGMIINFSFYGELFVISLYFQQIMGYPPLLAGLAILPQTGVVAAASAVGGKLTSRSGPRRSMMSGLLIGGIGMLGLLAVGPSSPYSSLIVPLAAVGLGIGLTMPAATAAVLHAAPPERAGIASAVLNTSRQIGSALGVALLGTLISEHSQFIPGMHTGVVIGSAAFLFGAALTLGWVERAS